MTAKSYLPAAAAFFTASVLTLGTLYAGVLSSALAVPPWLWLFLLGSALESAYYAAYFLTPRTPWSVRLVELAVWLVPLYFLSGRSWADSLWPAFLTFVSWLTARGYGSQLVTMERVADVLGDQAASTVSWEYESLTSSSNDLAIGFFWRRLIVFGLGIAVLAVASHGRTAAEPSSLALALRLAANLAVISGLALQAGAYLFRLEILWSYAQAVVDGSLTRLWFRNLGLVLLVLLLVVNLAPVNYSPLTAETVGKWASRLFQQEVDMTAFQESAGQESPSLPRGEQEWVEPEEPGLAAVILAVLILFLFGSLVMMVLAALGFLLLYFTRTEIDRLRGVPRLAVEIYLAVRRAAAQLWMLLRRIKASLPTTGGGAAGQKVSELGQETSSRQLRPWGRNVRALLRRIAAQAGKKGLPFRPSYTAWEYAQVLKGSLRQEEGLIQRFFQGYHQVRYGPEEMDGTEEEQLLEVGTEILKKIEEWEGER